MDWKHPNYTEILAERAARLNKLRGDPKLLSAAKIHYAHHPWDFVNDWGMTFDPRNIERGLPATIPFVLFPRQIEYLKWVYDLWQRGERGLTEKSRDFGATWLAGGFAATMWVVPTWLHCWFPDLGKRNSLIKKEIRRPFSRKSAPFIRMLPREFKPVGYNEREHASFMKILNPENGSTITGESGDEIGRGGRMSIYFVDEAAFITHQESVDAALSQTTNCQIDISTPNGNGNAFYKKRHNGKTKVFVMDWKDDPRKDQAWYDKQVAQFEEVIVAQEIDRDYNASQENVFVPAKWIDACVDAHKKLGWEPSGVRVCSFDPADVGDAKAYGTRHGSLVEESIQLKDGDITFAVPMMKEFVSKQQPDFFVYDSDGMGAPIIKLAIRDEFEHKGIDLVPFMGASTDFPNPTQRIEELDKIAKDAFLNMRAWAWWHFRNRAEKTYNAVKNGVYANPRRYGKHIEQHQGLRSTQGRA